MYKHRMSSQLFFLDNCTVFRFLTYFGSNNNVDVMRLCGLEKFDTVADQIPDRVYEHTIFQIAVVGYWLYGFFILSYYLYYYISKFSDVFIPLCQ